MNSFFETLLGDVRPTATRRQLLVLGGISAFTALRPLPLLAWTPLKQNPTPLDELIKRFTLVIYTGRFKRQVWIKDALAKKLYMEGAVIDPSELKLSDLSDIDINQANTGFFEIEHAQPIFKNPSAISMPLHRGMIYCYGYSFREGITEAERLVGKDVIFLFAGLPASGVGETTFPKPVYTSSGDGHWRDNLPITISELKTVTRIAKKAGFVIPSKRNSILL